LLISSQELTITFGGKFIFRVLVLCEPNVKFVLALWAPLNIHFGGQANLFDPGLRHEKAALALARADFHFLGECKNFYLPLKSNY
jgi:hypothetical protein